MLVTKTIEWDMGHRIPDHKSKCKNIHGHRYKMEVGVEGDLIREGSSKGMVIDFGDLKKIMVKVVDKLDHGFMVQDIDPFRKIFDKFVELKQKIIYVRFTPTVENIAEMIYDELERELSRKKINIRFVKIWETPTSCAIFNGDD